LLQGCKLKTETVHKRPSGKNRMALISSNLHASWIWLLQSSDGNWTQNQSQCVP